MADDTHDQMSSPEASGSGSKRRKTSRACDSCRLKKLKCIFNAGSSECAACQKSHSPCEFVKPAKIDKRRLRTLVERAETESERQWIAEQVARRGIYTASTDLGALRKARPSAVGNTAQLLAQLPDIPTDLFVPDSSVPVPSGDSGTGAGVGAVGAGTAAALGLDSSAPARVTTKPVRRRVTRSPPRVDMSGRVGMDPSMRSMGVDVDVDAGGVSGSVNGGGGGGGGGGVESYAVPDMPRGVPVLKTSTVEPRIIGPTGAVSLLEEVADREVVTEHDRQFGLFRMGEGFVYSGNPDEPIINYELAQRHLELDVMDKLHASFVHHLAPVFSVIAPHRIPSVTGCRTPLLFAMLAIVSLDRNVPFAVYANIRSQFGKVTQDTVEHGSTLGKVQMLLVSIMSHEIHGATNMEGGSVAWIRTGLAIRQAQDIGLHRLNPRHWIPEMYADRMRAWICCVVADRWYGLAYGQPLAVNLLDCEDPYGEAEDLLRTPDDSWAFQKELYKLSCLAGKIYETMYRPNAMDRCTDDILHALLREMDQYIALVPEKFSFHGQATSVHGGILNLLIALVEILFFRSFIKLHPKIPAHITFQPKAPRWYRVVQRSQAAIQWMDVHGDILLDCWHVSKFAVTYCALAQYHHYLAEGDSESLRALATAKQLMHRWALGSWIDRPMPSRAKVADICNVFYKAARNVHQHAHPLIHQQHLHTTTSNTTSVTSSTVGGGGGGGGSGGGSGGGVPIAHVVANNGIVSGLTTTFENAAFHTSATNHSPEQRLYPAQAPADAQDSLDEWILELFRSQDVVIPDDVSFPVHSRPM